MENQNTNPPAAPQQPSTPVEEKKINIWPIIVIIGIVLIALIWYKYSRKAPAGEEQSIQTEEQTAVVSPTTTVPAAATSTTATPAEKPVTGTTVKGGTSPSATLSYTKALGIYRKSGYYYQFVKCKGNPGLITMKKGKQFMLDNRDPKAHTLAFGKQSYYLRGYGFVIATAKYVGKFFITCDGGGAASILVEP